VGVGALAAGVPLHLEESRGEALTLDGGPGETARRRSRALTVPLIVGGSVAVTTGIALIIYDAAKTKKAKNEARRTSFAPSISPSWAGLHIRGKF